ncbi:MAG: 3-phosphoshikimate 1-carboxyvinyltransferase, partial [Clostridiales bacterium]|nr:3-phosphoshikimate 1-carboxyvinyltransferase [Clostridiales bacterium]
MNIEITPKKLEGKVIVPPSKSVAHRLIISAALANGISKISNVYPSKDILATIDAMNAFGAEIKFQGDLLIVKGISDIPQKALCDCCESGSTLRFLIPVACALGVETTFLGRANLPKRPITPYLTELTKNGITFDYNNTMPFSVSGKLKSGIYEMAGDISSQFITGLLFALPMLEGDSEIVLTSRLESKPYVDITVSALKTYGVQVVETEKGYYIKGNQKYKPCDTTVEADYSQAAFFYVLNLLGSDIEICGLNDESCQGDKKIVEICKKIVYNENAPLKPFNLDCSDIPDLVPVLTV